jgi:hypothetical protein
MEPMLHMDKALVPYWVKPFGVEDEYAVVQSWDLAWSEKIGGDWLVCMTAMVERKTGHRTMLDIERWQRLTFDEQCKMIEAKWGVFNADCVIIESDASQRIWQQHMSRTTAVPVVAHASGTKSDFAVGVPGLLIAFENEKWTFPYARGTHHHDEMQVFMAELEAFGWVDGKLQGIGEHDDTVMCFWHLCYGLDRMVTPVGRSQYRRGNQPGAYI